MQKEYYLNKLYPFQDEIFEIVDNLYVDFYLTGGTALSRFYFNHRYSDDLDFFVNNSKTFEKDAGQVINAIKEKANLIIVRKTSDFIRTEAKKNDTTLKIDFINDIEFKSGEVVKFDKFSKVDNLHNILTNKLTALGRLEPKDVVDVLFLWRKNKIDWEKAFEDAGRKEAFIDPLDVSVILEEFPKEYLERINWVNEINIDEAMNDIKRIAKEILLKSGE